MIIQEYYLNKVMLNEEILSARLISQLFNNAEKQRRGELGLLSSISGSVNRPEFAKYKTTINDIYQKSDGSGEYNRINNGDLARVPHFYSVIEAAIQLLFRGFDKYQTAPGYENRQKYKDYAKELYAIAKNNPGASVFVYNVINALSLLIQQPQNFSLIDIGQMLGLSIPLAKKIPKPSEKVTASYDISRLKRLAGLSTLNEADSGSNIVSSLASTIKNKVFGNSEIITAGELNNIWTKDFGRSPDIEDLKAVLKKGGFTGIQIKSLMKSVGADKKSGSSDFITNLADEIVQNGLRSEVYNWLVRNKDKLNKGKSRFKFKNYELESVNATPHGTILHGDIDMWADKINESASWGEKIYLVNKAIDAITQKCNNDNVDPADILECIRFDSQPFDSINDGRIVSRKIFGIMNQLVESCNMRWSDLLTRPVETKDSIQFKPIVLERKALVENDLGRNKKTKTAKPMYESALSRPLVVVDVQPAYESHISFETDMAEYLNKRTGKTLMYVNADDSGTTDDSLYSIQEWWLDAGLEAESFDRIKWFDKGYGYLREAIDYGASESDIISVIREMYRQSVSDSRDLYGGDEEKIIEIFGEDAASWINSGISVGWIAMGELKSMSPFYLCGGARDECLKEITLMCNALNIKYHLIDRFIY